MSYLHHILITAIKASLATIDSDSPTQASLMISTLTRELRHPNIQSLYPTLQRRTQTYSSLPFLLPSSSSASSGSSSGNQPQTPKSTVNSPITPLSTLTPSALSAVACLSAPPGPLTPKIHVHQQSTPSMTISNKKGGVMDFAETLTAVKCLLGN